MCTDSGTTSSQLDSHVGAGTTKADNTCEAEEVIRLEKYPTEDTAKPDEHEKCPEVVVNNDEAEKEITRLEKCPADVVKPDGGENEDTKLEKPSPPSGSICIQPTVTNLNEGTLVLTLCDQSVSSVDSASQKLPMVESKAEEDTSHDKESESNHEMSTNVFSCEQLDEHVESDQQLAVESKAKEHELPSDTKSEVSDGEDSESHEEDMLLDYPAVPQDMSKLVLSTEFSHEDLLDPDHKEVEDSLISCQKLFQQQPDMNAQLHSDQDTSNPCAKNVNSSSFSGCDCQGDIQSAEVERTQPSEKPELESNDVETLDCAVQLMDEGDSDPVGHDLPTSDLHSSRSKLGELLRNLPVPGSEVQEEDEDLEKSDIHSELAKSSSTQDIPKVFMCGEFLSLDGGGEMQVAYHPSSQEESARRTKRKSRKQRQKQKQKQKQSKSPGATPKKSPTRKTTPKKAIKEAVLGPGGEAFPIDAVNTEIVVPPDLDYQASKVPLKPSKSLRKKKKKVKTPLQCDFPVVTTETLPQAELGELTAPTPSPETSENVSSTWPTSSKTSEVVHLSVASKKEKGKGTKRKGHTIKDSSMISKPKKRKKSLKDKEMVPCESSFGDLLVNTSKVAVIDLSKHGEPCSGGTKTTTEKGLGNRKKKGWYFLCEVGALVISNFICTHEHNDGDNVIHSF